MYMMAFNSYKDFVKAGQLRELLADHISDQLPNILKLIMLLQM